MLRRLAWLNLLFALLFAGILYLPRSQHVFWQTEAFSLRLLVPLAALLVFASNRSRSTETTQLKHVRGVLMLLIGAWFLSAGLAGRPDLAIQELAIWLCYPLVAFTAWQFASDERKQSALLNTILVAGTLQALYGILQSANLEAPLTAAWGTFCRNTGLPSFGFDKLNWNNSFGGRAGGFLGNPNFLGGHLAMLLPVSVVVTMQATRHKPLYWIMTALMAAALVASQTRGAWIGATAGLLLMFWFLRQEAATLLKQQRGTLIALFIAILLASATFFALHRGNLTRLSQTNKTDDAISQRITLMRIASAVAIAHPLLGAGPGNFRIEFPAKQATGLSTESMKNRPYIISEHAHNDVIQMAADAGIPAALLWLALLCLVFKALARSINVDGDLLNAGILGGLVGLQIHGLANFPFLIGPTQITAWVLAVIGLRGLETKLQPMAPSTPRHVALTIALLMLATAAYLLNSYDAGRRLYKDALWWMGAGEVELGNYDAGGELVLRTIDIDRREDRLWVVYGRSQMERRMTINASGSFKEAVRLNPHDHDARVRLARSLIEIREFADAEKALQPSVLEAPNFPDIWEPMAVSLYMQGKYEASLNAFDWAVFHNIKPASMLENKSAALGSLGKYREALEALAKAEKIEPGRAKTHLNRAITYTKMGVKILAKQELQKAISIDASDPQINELRKIIR